jgi:hypothetical protein
MALSLGGITGGVTKWASGFSWQLILFKFLACAAILVLVGVACYREGMHDAVHKQDQAQITLMTRNTETEHQFIRDQLKTQQVEITKRLEVINPQAQEARQLRADMNIIRGRLDEAINKRPADPACAPSDDELRQYEEVAARTNANSR